jgi:hypothetical protein
MILLLTLGGCADLGFDGATFERPFRFEQDSFAFANELVWSYDFDADGTRRASQRSPGPEYTHRCFVLARSARQFFQHARFDPSLAPPDETSLRALVRRVVRTSPRRRLEGGERIVVPGFASLRELSRAHEALLKEELGGATWSYTERGNWRMVIPFSRRHQADTARRLAAALDQHRPPIVHLVRFPHITINHAMLLYAYVETPGAVRFAAYDPNQPGEPATLVYEHASRTFRLDRNPYFGGGRVDVYEIYHRPWF